MSHSKTGGGAPSETPPRVLTVEEAAKILRISRGLAFNAIHSGHIPHLRIGRRILIPETALNTLLGHWGTSACAEPTLVSSDQPVPGDSPADAKVAALLELATTLETLIAETQADLARQGGH